MHVVSSHICDLPPTPPTAPAIEVYRLSPATRLTRRLEQLRELAQKFAAEKDLAAKLDNLTKERDALKKTATDRALRIAELEAQVADQAERQKQIDEEMTKAEGQLDMLKGLLLSELS
jgi:hypothetical protein